MTQTLRKKLRIQKCVMVKSVGTYYGSRKHLHYYFDSSVVELVSCLGAAAAAFAFGWPGGSKSIFAGGCRCGDPSSQSSISDFSGGACTTLARFRFLLHAIPFTAKEHNRNNLAPNSSLSPVSPFKKFTVAVPRHMRMPWKIMSCKTSAANTIVTTRNVPIKHDTFFNFIWIRFGLIVPSKTFAISKTSVEL